MLSAESSKRVVEIERDILRALCHAPRASGALEATKAALSGYVWLYQEHGVVFEALQQTRLNDSTPLREQLPARATRMGFPDVDWSLYFDEAFRPQDIEHLVRDLKEVAKP
jgi:hypothetical protein